MAPNGIQPVKNSIEVTENSPLLKSNSISNTGYYNTAPLPIIKNHETPIIHNPDGGESQHFYAKTYCKCSSKFFSIGAIGLIFLGGMTVGCYLLHQNNYEWVTNAPFELVDRKNWQILESFSRGRSSRSETRNKEQNQQTKILEKSISSATEMGLNTKENALTHNQNTNLEVFSEQENSTTGKEKASYIVIAHTEGPSCYRKEHCLQIVRQLHVKSITEMGLLDIPYNFLIGGDGQTYEGRGWHTHHALRHTIKNQTLLTVALIGDFDNELPSRKQLDEVKAFIIESIRRRKLSPHYHLVGHRQINGKTKSPGDALMREIAGWKHWRPCSNNFC